MIIIPAIDLIDGKCVRLEQGDFTRSKYYGDPVDTAKMFEGAGLSRLHLVDLDGARSGKIANLETLSKLASQTHLQIDFSGGIREEDDLQNCFDAGAKWAGVGSIAVADPEKVKRWIDRFGATRIIIGADVRQGNVLVRGWQEKSEMTIQQLIDRFTHWGIRQFTCTDVEQDGMMKGPAVDLYRGLKSQYSEVEWIASGGVGSIDDLMALQDAGCYGAIVGKAIYEGKISLKDLAKLSDAC